MTLTRMNWRGTNRGGPRSINNAMRERGDYRIWIIGAIDDVCMTISGEMDVAAAAAVVGMLMILVVIIATHWPS